MATKLKVHRLDTGGGTVRDTVGLAVGILLPAFDAACELKRTAWEFAVELRVLERAGVTVTDLRWLLAKAYAEHGTEQIRRSARRRRFRRTGHFAFTDNKYVLQPNGV